MGGQCGEAGGEFEGAEGADDLGSPTVRVFVSFDTPSILTFCFLDASSHKKRQRKHQLLVLPALRNIIHVHHPVPYFGSSLHMLVIIHRCLYPPLKPSRDVDTSPASLLSGLRGVVSI